MATGSVSPGTRWQQPATTAEEMVPASINGSPRQQQRQKKQREWHQQASAAVIVSSSARKIRGNDNPASISGGQSEAAPAKVEEMVQHQQRSLSAAAPAKAKDMETIICGGQRQQQRQQKQREWHRPALATVSVGSSASKSRGNGTGQHQRRLASEAVPEKAEEIALASIIDNQRQQQRQKK